MNKQDRWSALSMKDRADLIKLYIESGITDLGEMKKDYNGIPYRDFNTSEYDYFNAHPSNAPTKEAEHWTSRNPKTGRLLKREDHPTFDLMIKGEKQAGYKVIRGYNGELYSIPNEPTNYVEYYNSFSDGGFVDWDKVDRFVEKAEPWVSGVSLASTGAALAISAASAGTAAPVALPVAGIISTVANGAGMLMDGYQSVRALTEGDYKKALGNGIEAVMGGFGNKFASKLAKTTGGRAIGKYKEALTQERFANSGEKITRLMRKGLSYEEAAERVFKNAANYADNSSKVRDVATGIQDAYNQKFKKAAQIADTVFDVKDTGVGIHKSFREEHPIEIYKIGGKLNKFETGGPTNQNVDSNWLKSFKELPDGYKKAVLQLVTDLNYDVKDAESLYNSGKLKAVIEAKYQNTPSGRARQNDSPTSTESSNLEKKMNKMLYNSTDRVLPNMKYAIPYIKELEIKVPGVGRTTTNALDSLAKYAVQAQIPLSEALGLSAQETAFGALPQYNYVEVVGTEEEKQKAKDFNRALGNSSYFRNYGIIPAENFVRDFRYNIVKDPIDRDVPPLLHAFNYWKKGNYNKGDSDHTKDVKAKGEAVMKTKVIQDWINSSKFAQEALNLSK